MLDLDAFSPKFRQPSVIVVNNLIYCLTYSVHTPGKVTVNPYAGMIEPQDEHHQTAKQPLLSCLSSESLLCVCFRPNANP